MLLPFDAHNHIHMGPTPLEQASLETSLCGMAVMSTHPRDYEKVLNMKGTFPNVVPCLGVHPWFLHELSEDDWEPVPNNSEGVKTADNQDGIPRWILNLENLLVDNPGIPVGEIGLDGFHFDPVTKDLTTSMDRQVLALEHQLTLAIKHQRPVSMHCVRAMGKTMETLSKVQKVKHPHHKKRLPPSIYFHAFGGKAATVTQLTKSLEKKNATKLYFGFAPIINFASHKTLEVIQTVGLDRLVLETDHEDAARVCSSMDTGLKTISDALDVSVEELVQRTNYNAQQLYDISGIECINT